MSFAEGVAGVSFDLADPTMMLWALGAVIIVCLALDAPAITGAIRLVRVLRRRSRSIRVGPRR